jgi:ATP-dependent exoDNAse (exonuclease V) alpha subunit
MPCVFLDVSKRAAEGSNITASSNIINDYSLNSNWRQLESKDDFFLLKCNSSKIQQVVYDLCAYYLKRKTADQVSYLSQYLGIEKLPEVEDLTPDDIQVVTPLQKETYTWGSSKLNEILQPLFNKTKGYNYTFIYQTSSKMKGRSFIINDRVIHTETNMYSMQWYSSYEDGIFQKVYGCGICNGEVGKIVSFISADDCTFYDEVDDKPDNFKYPENLRQDKSWKGDGRWFVVVEYYDYISEKKIYILYRAEENIEVQSNRGVVLKGEDLSKLNLFYAGTVHKLQGSQAKLIICPLDTVTYRGFITRQMVYTMITRGEKLVYCVGSVGNEQGSMLSKARQDIASKNTKTLGELFV